MYIKEKIDLWEKTLKSERLYSGNIINVNKDLVEFANGDTKVREVVEHADLAVIFPVLDNGEIVLEKHYRHPHDSLVIEAVAGKRDLDEDINITAYRELEEETGLKAAEIKMVGMLQANPPYIKQLMYFFVAKGLKEGTMRRDKNEYMDIFSVSLEDLLRMIKDGEIQDMKTVAMATLYQLKK